MQISVIIPVYNAERYLSRAIESALTQKETKEILLVEDGSPDQGLRICREYASRHENIILLRHPNGENRGAGASFNLGIRHARAPFVAFLGADDEYVPDAFALAQELFAQYPDADGVYAHIGVKYHDPEYKSLHLKRVPREISGMHTSVPPEDLLRQLLMGNQGHISLDSVVLRREILTEAFFFDESLRQAQDTDFMFRLAAAYRLYGPAETQIVALRGVHAGNRVFKFDEAAIYQRRIALKCIRNRFYGCHDRIAAQRIIKRYMKGSIPMQLPLLPVSIKRRMAYLLFLMTHPPVLLQLLRMKGANKNENGMNKSIN